MENEELQVFDLAFRFQLLFRFCLTRYPHDAAVFAGSGGSGIRNQFNGPWANSILLSAWTDHAAAKLQVL